MRGIIRSLSDLFERKPPAVVSTPESQAVADQLISDYTSLCTQAAGPLIALHADFSALCVQGLASLCAHTLI